MPPKIQYCKADILHSAFKITRKRGIAALNARAIARDLGCSTQPIFRAFKSMEDIKDEMIRMGMGLYRIYIQRSSDTTVRPYLQTGLAYVAFAREEPELFKLLFMRDRVSEGTQDEKVDRTVEYVIDLVMRRTGLNRAQAEDFHRHVWIFTHGLAVMIATGFINVPNDVAQKLMMDEYRSMRKLYGLPPSPDDETDGPEP